MTSVLMSPPHRAVIVQGEDVAVLEDLARCAERFLESKVDRDGRVAEFDRLRVMQMQSLAERIRLL